MRITKVEIKDFRGFPGPGTYAFDLDGGKNLLIYGENGSGKSSLFRALVEFFNLNPRAKPFADYKNIFSDPDLTDGYIGVHFDDGESPSVWSFSGARPTAEARVAETALRKGCLDYRSLLRTNFVHESRKVNLFELIVEGLLANYPAQSAGRTIEIGNLWQRVLATKPVNHRGRNVERMQRACARRHLRDNDERAAAVYARAAFERKLQRYCEKNAVLVRYHTDQRRMDAEWFWQAIKKKAQDEGKTAALQPMFSQIETYRKIVLNPLSHANTATVTRAEIQGAIDAIDGLKLDM